MGWISQEKRLAVYLRDGLCCCWCGYAIEDDVLLTLDHLICRCEGGSDKARNLITACTRCNHNRGNRPAKEFAVAVGLYLDVPANKIVEHIETTRRRPLDQAAAVALIRRRGSYSQALKELIGSHKKGK